MGVVWDEGSSQCASTTGELHINLALGALRVGARAEKALRRFDPDTGKRWQRKGRWVAEDVGNDRWAVGKRERVPRSSQHLSSTLVRLVAHTPRHIVPIPSLVLSAVPAPAHLQTDRHTLSLSVHTKITHTPPPPSP
jgi:hypothetical protein